MNIFLSVLVAIVVGVGVYGNFYLCVLIAALVSLGVYSLLQPNLMRTIIGILLLTNAGHLILFVGGGLGERITATVPKGQSALPPAAIDPVPQALILTAIVISFAVTTYFLALCREYYFENADAAAQPERPQ